MGSTRHEVFRIGKAGERAIDAPLVRAQWRAALSKPRTCRCARRWPCSAFPARPIIAPSRQIWRCQIACQSTGYDRWSERGLDGLEDATPQPGSVWNRLPDETRADIVEFALEHEDLTPREMAVKYTDEKQYFVSESSVYRILKAEDLVTAPAHIVMKAANEFKDQTTRPNELWQTDFTYLKVLGGAGFTCRPSSTTTVGTSSPGSSARR